MNNIDVYVKFIVDFFTGIGPIGGFFLIMFESILPPIPVGVVVGLNMLAFGSVLGFILSYIACLCGCTMSFFLFRYLFKGKVTHRFSEKNRNNIEEWKSKISNMHVATLALLVALPITPAFAVNISAGLSDMNYKKFLVSIMIGKPAMLFFYGYTTVSFIDSLKDPMSLIRIILIMLGVYIVSKIVEKVVKVEK